MAEYGWLIGLGIILLAVVGTVFWLKEKIRALARLLFGSEDFKKGIEERACEDARTPKSISSMTDTYLPLIQRDFPGFNWTEYRQKAANVLKSALLARSERSAARLSELANADLQKQTELAVSDDRSHGVTHVYRDITVHRTEIIGYEKNAGTCAIKLRSAVGHIAFVQADGGDVLNGRTDLPVQTRYDTELVYIQDAEKAALAGTAFGVNCPNCGAPVRSLGEKRCAYCGTAIDPVNTRVWSFGAVREA